MPPYTLRVKQVLQAGPATGGNTLTSGSEVLLRACVLRTLRAPLVLRGADLPNASIVAPAYSPLLAAVLVGWSAVAARPACMVVWSKVRRVLPSYATVPIVRQGNAYKKAVELSRQVCPLKTASIEKEWGEWLLSVHQVSAVVPLILLTVPGQYDNEE